MNKLKRARIQNLILLFHLKFVNSLNYLNYRCKGIYNVLSVADKIIIFRVHFFSNKNQNIMYYGINLEDFGIIAGYESK